MTQKDSKSKSDLAYFEDRLDAAGMTGYERLQAKARIAQALAVAEALAGLGRWLKRVACAAVVRPFRRLTTSLG